MRDYERELAGRTAFIRDMLSKSGASGIVFGNSGGKDSALVGIICKKACENTVGIMLPCGSTCNFGSDMSDAKALAGRFGIETRTIDLTPAKSALVTAVFGENTPSGGALVNIAPRLRMTALYSVAASEGRLVAGTGNRSERYMGYFTKWGDGACDFNPISDLTVSEVYGFLEYLGAPRSISEKAPSAGLYEGQTDEADMGVTYAAIEEYLNSGHASDGDRKVIERYHSSSLHKLRMPETYDEWISGK